MKERNRIRKRNRNRNLSKLKEFEDLLGPYGILTLQDFNFVSSRALTELIIAKEGEVCRIGTTRSAQAYYPFFPSRSASSRARMLPPRNVSAHHAVTLFVGYRKMRLRKDAVRAM